KVSKPLIMIVNHCVSQRDRKKFYDGIAEIEDKSIQQFDLGFSQCSDEEKSFILNSFSKQDNYFNPLVKKIRDKLFGQSFFGLLKSLVVLVYCTSEVGATVALGYDPVPINYVPCVAYTGKQKSWALK